MIDPSVDNVRKALQEAAGRTVRVQEAARTAAAELRAERDAQADSTGAAIGTDA